MALLLLMLAILLGTVAAAPVIKGSLVLDGKDMSLSYVLTGATSSGAGTVQFTLQWSGSDWAALGLHAAPGSGMPNAEIFMCSNTPNSTAFCQVRNTGNSYDAPSLNPHQYLKLVSHHHSGGTNTAVFERSVCAVAGAPRSVGLGFNKTNGLIYARGNWSGPPMPQGNPTQHFSEGRSQLNFYSPPAPSPSPGPGPGPSPSPSPKKKAGVWPVRFDAQMTIAPSALNAATLATVINARLRYDFKRADGGAPSQLWEYFNPDTGENVGNELWVGDILYNYGKEGKGCTKGNMTFGILRPDWLQGTHYTSTHFLLRQLPNDANATSCAGRKSNYTKADLFQIPNTIAMTNSWVVADSPVAEPIRLEGPDDFNKPKFVSILEYVNFVPQPDTPFPTGTFTPPASCGTGKTDAEGEEEEEEEAAAVEIDDTAATTMMSTGKGVAGWFNGLGRR